MNVNGYAACDGKIRRILYFYVCFSTTVSELRNPVLSSWGLGEMDGGI